MKEEIVMEVSDLCIGYGEKTVVEELSFSLRRGEILCLAGESGCGKSTVLKALLSSGDVKLTDGEIR
ncbi:MAG: ATP-binding cassette domain-containing protein, partial [Lachnospiraceae bacterium]|nr:ATP-binding cassette domain-containing protein [Lachnospiraceae bacterium]